MEHDVPDTVREPPVAHPWFRPRDRSDCPRCRTCSPSHVTSTYNPFCPSSGPTSSWRSSNVVCRRSRRSRPLAYCGWAPLDTWRHRTHRLCRIGSLRTACWRKRTLAPARPRRPRGSRHPMGPARNHLFSRQRNTNCTCISSWPAAKPIIDIFVEINVTHIRLTRDIEDGNPTYWKIQVELWCSRFFIT